MSNAISPETAKLALDAAEKVLNNTTFYEDALKPYAKAIGTCGKAINVCLAPISGMVWGYDKISNYIKSSLEKKFESKQVPPENIISPDPLIAGPLINNFKFLGDHESLRDMYSNLLATSMNKETASTAHPCFVEIIKQLSSDEAKIMKTNFKTNSQSGCIVKILAESKTQGFKVIKEHLSLIPNQAECEYSESFPAYLENLTRLGLLNYTYDTSITDENYYRNIEKLTTVKNILKNIDEDLWYQKHNYYSRVKKGIVTITPLGEQFQKACIG